MHSKFLSLCLLFFTLILTGRSNAQDKVPKLLISHLTADFYIYTTFGNPGDGSLFPANGMYLVTNKGVVLFDTPWDSTQFQPLLDTIRQRHGKAVIMCLSTHFHEDRTAGLSFYKGLGIATYTSQRTDVILRDRNAPRPQFVFQNDSVFSIGEYKFATYYPGKGHSSDNIVIWFAEAKVLYGGCFIKSTDTNSPGNLADADLDAWIRSVRRLQAKFSHPTFVIPGHQNWRDSRAVQHTLRVLRKYKRGRE